MFSASIRSALRPRALASVSRIQPVVATNVSRVAISNIRMYSSDHHEESFEEFTARYVPFQI